MGSNTNITIDCDGTNVCQSAEFDLHTADYVSITCTSDGMLFSFSILYLHTLFATTIHLQMNTKIKHYQNKC